MLGALIQHLHIISLPCRVGACGQSSDFFGHIIYLQYEE